MTDIALTWQEERGDIAVTGDDLAAADGLDTAVLLSLFLDRRAEASDGIPLDQDPRGWWADTFSETGPMGSRLWLLAREKQLPSVAERARSYAAESLAWLVDEGVAESVDVAAEWIAQGTLAISVAIARPNKPPFNRQFQYVWSAF